MRRVTFSRNYTLSLSRTCRCYCKYCSFATHRAHLYSPEEVERLLGDAERRVLPHTNLGVLDADELARLREVTASQGLMLESVNPDLVVHQGSPTKHPAARLETIRAAGELRIPFTSGILVGIGEAPEERIAALEALAEVHAEHGHLQEVILQPFVPHRRYYGAEPAEIAERSQLAQTPPRLMPLPAWAQAVTLDEMRLLV